MKYIKNLLILATIILLMLTTTSLETGSCLTLSIDGDKC